MFNEVYRNIQNGAFEGASAYLHATVLNFDEPHKAAVYAILEGAICSMVFYGIRRITFNAAYDAFTNLSKEIIQTNATLIVHNTANSTFLSLSKEKIIWLAASEVARIAPITAAVGMVAGVIGGKWLVKKLYGIDFTYKEIGKLSLARAVTYISLISLSLYTKT